MKRSEELQSMPNHIAYDNSTIGQANQRTWINNNFGSYQTPPQSGYGPRTTDIMTVSPYDLSDEDLLALIDALKVRMDQLYRSDDSFGFSAVQDRYDLAKSEAQTRGILDNLGL